MCFVRSLPTVRMLPSVSTDPTSGRPSTLSQGKMMNTLLNFAGVEESRGVIIELIVVQGCA